MAKKKNIDKQLLNELEEKQRELKRVKKQRSKKAERARRKAEEEARKRQEYKLIQSTQMSVPIRDVLHSVIVTKDGRYLKIMEFAPQNFLMLSHAEQNRIGQAFEGMLHTVPAKVQFKVFSRKAKTESLLEIMRKSHESEKNALCRRMQEEYIQQVEDTALREGVTRRFFVIIEYADEIASDGSNFRAIVASLNQSAARIRMFLDQAGVVFLNTCENDHGVNELLYEVLNRRASETELFAKRAERVYTHYITDSVRSGEEAIPPIPATEFIAPAWIDYTHPQHLVVDNKFYTFGYFSSERFPNYVVAGWLAGFINASEGIDLDIFMERVPKHKVENSIGRRIRNNRAKLKETSDTTTEAASVASLIQSGFYLLNGLASGEDFFYTGVLITVTADTLTELERRYDMLEQMAQSVGIKLRRTTFQMEEAFESSLPLCKMSRSIWGKARRNMLSSGAASFFPFISSELQDPNGIALGVSHENNSIVAVDVFNTKKHSNANGCIVGKSGYGKTFTAQLLAIRMRLQDIQTFIITPMKGKEDYKRACDQIDGQYIALGPGTPYSINVFDIHVPDTEGLVDLDGYGEETSLLAKKVQDLHTFFHLVVRDLTQEEEQMLDGYIYKVYEQFGITEDNDSVFVPGTRKYKEFPLLGDLFDAIKDEPVLRKVYNILVPLVNGSLSVYNRKTNVNLDNKYIVFDMNGTKGQNLALSMFVTLDFVWSKIKENRLAKKAVFVDEAWQLIGTQGNEMAAEYVKEIFKTIRAFGGSAFVMTQEITDFFALKNGEYGKAIISNSDTKICLHLDNVEADMMSEIMNLSDDEYKKITTLQRGNGMVATGNTKLFVDFKASPFEKDVITTDPEYLRRKMRDEAAIRQAEMQTSGLLPDAPETDPAKPEENRQVVDLDDFEDADEISLASDDILDFQQETEPKPELEPVVQNNP